MVMIFYFSRNIFSLATYIDFEYFLLYTFWEVQVALAWYVQVRDEVEFEDGVEEDDSVDVVVNVELVDGLLERTAPVGLLVVHVF